MWQRRKQHFVNNVLRNNWQDPTRATPCGGFRNVASYLLAFGGPQLSFSFIFLPLLDGVISIISVQYGPYHAFNCALTSSIFLVCLSNISPFWRILALESWFISYYLWDLRVALADTASFKQNEYFFWMNIRDFKKWLFVLNKYSEFWKHEYLFWMNILDF